MCTKWRRCVLVLVWRCVHIVIVVIIFGIKLLQFAIWHIGNEWFSSVMYLLALCCWCLCVSRTLFCPSLHINAESRSSGIWPTILLRLSPMLSANTALNTGSLPLAPNPISLFEVNITWKREWGHFVERRVPEVPDSRRFTAFSAPNALRRTKRRRFMSRCIQTLSHPPAPMTGASTRGESALLYLSIQHSCGKAIFLDIAECVNWSSALCLLTWPPGWMTFPMSIGFISRVLLVQSLVHWHGF